MIFKLDGGIENLLALTPVLVEWRRRFGAPVFVETQFPEIFNLNPYVDKAALYITEYDKFFDLNLIHWHKILKCVTESYAERILGDLYLTSWRPLMVNSKTENAKAQQMVGPRTATVYFSHNMMDPKRISQVIEAVASKGYTIFPIVPEEMSVGLQRAIIAHSSVFVGTDSSVSAIALTTDVPAVVCYSYRDPCFFPPFRGNVPFEMVRANECDCDSLKICIAQNVRSEYAKIYDHFCPKNNPWACRKIDFGKAVSNALDKIFARARV